MNFWQSFAHEKSVTAFAGIVLVLFYGCKPNDGSSSYLKGQNAFDVRDFSRAVRSFTDTTMRNPLNADAWVMLSRSHLELGELPKAKEALEEAARLAGGDYDVIELAGQIAYHSKDEKKARAAYEMLMSETFPDAIRSRGACGLAIVDMAGMVGSDADVKRASSRVRLLEALRFNSTNASARYHLGRLYRDAFDYREAALDQFSLYVRLETQSVDRVKRVQQRIIPDLKEAVARIAAAFPGADRRDSSLSASALKKADDAFRKASYKIARQRYQEAYKADALSFQAALGLAKSIEKGDSSQSGMKEALKYYRLASQLRPSSSETLMAAGNLAMKTSAYVVAAEAYSRALAARPGDISAIDGLIRALQKTGDSKSAAVYQAYRDRLPKRTSAR